MPAKSGNSSSSISFEDLELINELQQSNIQMPKSQAFLSLLRRLKLNPMEFVSPNQTSNTTAASKNHGATGG